MEYKYVNGEQVELTAEEIAQRDEQRAIWAAGEDDRAAEANRNKRNALLAETDYLALSDNTMSAEMTAYRQALRDITTHTNWPNLSDADWPVKP